MERCKDCTNFERALRHPAYGGGEMFGGWCDLLTSVISLDNLDDKTPLVVRCLEGRRNLLQWLVAVADVQVIPR